MAAPSAIPTAYEDFDLAMRDPTNLVEIHRDLTAGPGRRTREVALNRAIVVLTVAAWQALVQDLVVAGLKQLEPPPPERLGSYGVLRGLALRATHMFATPNAENTRQLLIHLGFDPWEAWQWWEGPIHMNDVQVRGRLNQWLRVRHAIAHGDRLPSEPVLSVTRAGPSLRLGNAEGCIRFFHRLATATTDGLAKTLA